MTNFKDRLDFVEETQKSNGYDTLSVNTKIKHKDIFPNKFNYDQITNIDEVSIYVTTRVKKSLMSSSNLYILSLDCDSEIDKNKATGYLEDYSISHYVIESSPSHYWIICNFVDSIHQVVEQMKLIPGVDKSYVDIADKRKVLNLRAFPKNGVIPKFTQNIPESTKSNNLYVQWLRDFAHYWISDEMVEAYYNYFYRWSISNCPDIRRLVREENRATVEGKIEACRSALGNELILEINQDNVPNSIEQIDLTDYF